MGRLRYYYLFSSNHNIKKMKDKGLDFGQEIMKYLARNWKYQV